MHLTQVDSELLSGIYKDVSFVIAFLPGSQKEHTHGKEEMVKRGETITYLDVVTPACTESHKYPSA